MSLRSGVIPEHWPSPVCLGPTRVHDEASENQDDPDHEPGQRIEVLIALDPGWRDMSARRPRPVAL